MVRGKHSHVSNCESSIPLTDLIVTPSEGDHLLDGTGPHEVGLGVTLAREESEDPRDLSSHFDLRRLGKVEEGTQASLLKHPALRATLNHLGDVSHSRDGVYLPLRIVGLG